MRGCVYISVHVCMYLRLLKSVHLTVVDISLTLTLSLSLSLHECACIGCATDRKHYCHSIAQANCAIKCTHQKACLLQEGVAQPLGPQPGSDRSYCRLSQATYHSALAPPCLHAVRCMPCRCDMPYIMFIDVKVPVLGW